MGLFDVVFLTCVLISVCRPAYPSVFARISMEIGRQYRSKPVILKIQIEFPESMEIAT